MNTPMQKNGEVSADKRGALRQRCLRAALCVFNKGNSNFSVMVRNISTTGAKLAGHELYRLPEEFELRINNGSGAVSTRRVRRMWSREDSIGVTFLGPELQSGVRPLQRTTD
jgi:PilZ domain-containing protein